MRKNNRKTAKLRMKIGICIAIIIAVLIVKKFDGHEMCIRDRFFTDRPMLKGGR